MNDYEEQLFRGTPEVTDEMREQILLEQERNRKRMEELQETESTDTPQQTAPKATAPEPDVEQQPEPTEQPTDKPSTNALLDNLNPEARALADAMDAPGQGILDFGADLLNMIPNIEAPKESPYESQVAQSVRELSSIVIPSIAIGGIGASVLKGATQGVRFLSDPGMRHIGKMAFQAGTGAFVDYVAQPNQEDDNFLGSVKKAWPRWTGWIPDNIATLDTDSPDMKRQKNVVEGVGLGIGPDILLGLGKLAAGITGVVRSTKWVPENELAENWFAKKFAKKDPSPAEVVDESAGKRSEALDELGQYNLEKSVNLDEPILGVHDAYGYLESGTRSADDLGIVGASVDVVRVEKNLDTVYGRVGSVVTEAALKKGLQSSKEQEILVRGLASQLQDAGEYGYNTASGKYISFDEVMESGEKIAADLFEMDLDSMRRTVRAFQEPRRMGGLELTDEGYAGVFKAIKLYMDDYMNMDYMRAQAYAGTSFAGQVSDMAQGMRLMDETPAIERAQEQILDRIEFLMAQKGMTSYIRGRALNMTNVWNRLTRQGDEAFELAEFKRVEKAIKNEKNPTLAALERIKQDASNTVDTLRLISKEQPEMLAPLFMAYELTDGKISTISQLNNYLRQSTGVLSKAFLDFQPEIPSVVINGFYSNLYNSTLSAFATPIKAGGSAAYLLAEKPIAAAVGSLRTRDTENLSRAWYIYTSSIGETLQDSFSYMGQVFKRSGTDPYVVAAREDMGVKNEKQLEILNAFADAKAQQGDYGPQVMMELVNNMDALAKSPMLRFGNRAMQAFDGFTQSMAAVAEAKGRAYDTVTKGGKVKLDKKAANELARQVKSEMFDSNGLITDNAAKITAGEIALNLDNVFNDNLSALIRRAPMLKPFLLFTKTPLNDIALSAQYNPVGLFVKQFNEFRLPYNQMDGKRIEELLGKRGITITDEITARNKYKEIRADMMGRKALGFLFVMGGISLFASDRLTGNGLYNRQKQALRREADWKPRSIRLPGGDWVSYDNLGPLTNWLALTADIIDNAFDSLSPDEAGELLKQIAFVFASSVTEKTTLAGLEPFTDVIRGDVSAINKWAASFLTSAAIPGSSQLAELSRLMDPGLKQVDMTMHELMMNRNPVTKGLLPAKYDWIDSGEVGIPDNFMARVWNTYMPWKVNGKLSPRKQFLIDIEYDARPVLRSNGKGVDYTPEEQSMIMDIIGRDDLFGKRVDYVMKLTDAKGFRKRYKEAVDAGLKPDLSDFESIHILLDRELEYAKKMAAAQMPVHTDASRRAYVQDVIGQYLRSGKQKEAEKFLKYMEESFSY